MLTFSHERNTWLARQTAADEWTPVHQNAAKLLADWGYVILDAV